MPVLVKDIGNVPFAENDAVRDAIVLRCVPNVPSTNVAPLTDLFVVLPS
jgi:hypothetical protein